MNPQRPRWEDRYPKGLASSSLEPSPLLIDHAELLRGAPRGQALDLACGNGRNSFFLASLGYEVTAVDVSEPAVAFVNERAAELGVRVRAREADLSHHELGDGAFAAILDFLFLDRNLVPRIIHALSPGGLLFFETLTVDERGALGHDVASDVLLEPNEPLRLFAPLRILHYREGVVTADSGRQRAVAQLIARKA
jgi:SAM-dependent methyltransferase